MKKTIWIATSNAHKVEEFQTMLKDCDVKCLKDLDHTIHIIEDGKEHVYRGECEGLIHDKLEGENGFGYDPIFYYPAFKTTLANVSEEKKNSVSHRGIALEKFLKDWSK